MQLPSSPMQNSDLLEETTKNEFILQFLRINITFTDDDELRLFWVWAHGQVRNCCTDFWRQRKKADEEVEDKNDVPQSSKCPFSHGEVMQKMDHYLAYYSYKPEGTPESVPQLVQFCEFSAKKQESTIKQTFIFFLFQQEFRYKLNCLLCNLFL